MSYDNPKVETYTFPSSAFGATTESRRFLGPKGRSGRVVDIRTYLTADGVGTTTVPEVNVGSAASIVGTLKTEYARHRLGTTAVLGNLAAGSPYRARALCQSNPNPGGAAQNALNDYAGHVSLETSKIPADTPFFITRVAGAGGTPAGTGITEVDVAYD